MNNLEPLYLCNMEKICASEGDCGGDMCHHTSDALFAANEDSVRIFNEFKNTFEMHVDEDGRIIAWEKETNNGSDVL